MNSIEVPIYDTIRGENFDEVDAVNEAIQEDTITDILKEKQKLRVDFEYCQERAALLRDMVDIMSRCGIVLTFFDQYLFLMVRQIVDDILSADEPVIPF